MNSLRRFLTLSFLLPLCGFGIAYAQGVTAGDYKLAVGHAAPCPVTLDADGTAKVGADCTHVSDVSHWRATPTGLQLQDNSGATIAVRTLSGDEYKGKTFENERTIVLTH